MVQGGSPFAHLEQQTGPFCSATSRDRGRDVRLPGRSDDAAEGFVLARAFVERTDPGLRGMPGKSAAQLMTNGQENGEALRARRIV